MIKGYGDKDLIIGCLQALKRKMKHEKIRGFEKPEPHDLMTFINTSYVRTNDGLPDDYTVVFLRNEQHTFAVYGVTLKNGKLRFRYLLESEY